MKKLMYAGTEILTGDDIAQALLALAGALAQTGDADTVEIPVLDADGSRTTALVLVGPASQIVAMDATTEFEELRDPDVVRGLLARANHVVPIAEPMTEDVPDQWIEDY